MSILIGLDIDGVVSETHSKWVAEYNRLSGDNLKVDEIVDWKISKFVKDGYKNKIPKLYDNILPVFGAIRGIKQLRDAGYKLLFITTPTKYTFGTKYFWLKKYHLLESDKEYIEAFDKSFINVDILVDDSFENIKKNKTIGILYNAPWNLSYVYPEQLRARNWKDVVTIIRQIQKLKNDKAVSQNV
jgi:5'(3')-deoxyribonucleotidase